MAVVDEVAVDMVLIQLTIMSTSKRTIGQTSIIKLKRHPCESVSPPCSSAYPKEKALQSIVVSCHRRKVVVALIPLDADGKAKKMSDTG